VAVTYQRADLESAIVTLEDDDAVCRFIPWIFVTVISVLALEWYGDSPRFKIVVRGLSSGKVLWTNHGYTTADGPGGCFEQVCDEIDAVGIDGFLRQRTPKRRDG
jgi:hypothetical protein